MKCWCALDSDHRPGSRLAGRSPGVIMFVLASYCGAAASGQQSGDVRGTVEDPDGGAVVQAAVHLTPKRGGAPSKTVSDDAGRFAFSGVGAGDYVLAAKKEGFEAAELN